MHKFTPAGAANVAVCQHPTWLACEFPDYRLCASCGSYRSIAAPDPKILYTPDYWTHECGHSTLAEQVYNLEQHKEGGRTKNDFIIEQLTRGTGAALEIGCAPGSLLRRLSLHGFERVVGVETNAEWGPTIRRVGEHEDNLIFGFFPEATRYEPRGSFSLVVGSDVFEHVPEPAAFLQECARLLEPWGQFLLIAPIIVDGQKPDARFFVADEHIWLHSADNLAEMCWEAGFVDVTFDRWCAGHESLSARRKA